MTIARKLTMLLVLSILGLIVLASGSAYQLSRLNNQLTAVTETTLPGIQQLDQIGSHFLRLRSLLALHVMNTVSSDAPEIEKLMAQRRQLLVEALKAYEPFIADSEERRLWEVDGSQLQGYLKLFDQVLHASQDGLKESGRISMLGNERDAERLLVQSLEAHAAYSAKLARALRDEARTTYRSASWMSTLATGGLIVAMLAIGLALLRSIVKPLSQMEGAVHEIKTRLDFTRQLEVRGDDEVAHTGTAVNQLLAHLRESLGGLRLRTLSVHQAAGELSDGAGRLSARANDQCEVSASMAGTVEQMTTNISLVAQRAREAKMLSSESGSMAENGVRVIEQTVEDINQIASSVRQAAEQIGALRTQSESITQVVKGYEVEKDIKMAVNDNVEIGGYTVTFRGVTEVQGPNFVARQGQMELAKDGQVLRTLNPEKRNYASSGMPMTEAAIDTGFARDVYVSLGEALDDQGTWSVRVYHKPFVDWIWGGCLLMALGGVLAIADRRYRLKRRPAAAGQVADEATSPAAV